MYIPVVLKGGIEELVSKEELQFLMVTQQLLFFKRSDGWAVIGRDEMRKNDPHKIKNERRTHEVFARGY